MGTYNPQLAHRSLEEDIEFGTLLPRTVVVYDGDDSDVIVSAVDTQHLIGVVDNDELDPIGDDADPYFSSRFYNTT
nr:DUF302 domain-containing protein [Natrinema sp. SYSU A 869]